MRAQGVPRPLAAAAAPAGAGEVAAAAALISDASGRRGAGRHHLPAVVVAPRAGRRTWTALGMVATIAAAVILSVLTTTLVVGSRVDAQLAAQAETISALEDVTVTTMAVIAQPDAEHVTLAGVTDPAADGNLVFSPSTTELAVVATGLVPPPAGYEYRCWVSVEGSRQRIGKMFFAEDIAYWVGPAPAISDGFVRPGADAFGVSLVGVSGTTLETDPVPSSAGSDRGVLGRIGRSAAGCVRHRRLAVPSIGRSRRHPVAVPPGRRGAAGACDRRYPGLTSTPSSAMTADSQAASRGRSTSSISDSRRRESMMTSQTSPAPTTSPTMSSQTLNSAFTAAKYRQRRPLHSADARFHPESDRLQLGPIPVYWYGIGYAVGLAAAYLVMSWLAKRAGEDAELLGNGMIIVAIAALIGGRAYHVIDQWALYKDDPLEDLPAAVLRPRASTAGSSRARSPRGCTRAARRPRSCAGRTSSRRACS